MFGQIAPTPYDMRFSLFGISVRVHPLFWLISAVLGWRGGGEFNPVTVALVWIGCVFVSILIHELGHALVAKAFGWHPHIVLYHMGGYAAYQPGWDNTPGKSILIALAGPFAGFAFFAVVFGVAFATRVADVNMGRFWPLIFGDLAWINIGWGVLNLLPIFPMDGGRVCNEICKKWSPQNGDRYTFQIGMLLAGAVALYFLSKNVMFAGMLFGMLAFQNYQMLQVSRHGRGW